MEQWTRPDTTFGQKFRDEADCRKYANMRMGYGPNRLIILGPRKSDTFSYFFFECMEAKGYKFAGTTDFPF